MTLRDQSDIAGSSEYPDPRETLERIRDRIADDGYASPALVAIHDLAVAALAAPVAPERGQDEGIEEGARVMYACLRELEPSFLHDWEAEGERTREGFIEAFRKARDAHDEWRVA